MILVGLTGGVATGKSTVARLFRRYGAYVIDADALARQVVQPGRPAWREIVQIFGKGVLRADRTIDRKALARLVFGHPAKLRRLERIIHPRVAREQARLVRAIAEKDPKAVVVYDVPLLFEAGVDKHVDRIIVVTADQATQIARLRKRNGLSRTQALRRVKAQLPMVTKIRRADYVIDGTQPLKLASAQVRVMYRQLKSVA